MEQAAKNAWKSARPALMRQLAIFVKINFSWTLWKKLVPARKNADFLLEVMEHAVSVGATRRAGSVGSVNASAIW